MARAWTRRRGLSTMAAVASVERLRFAGIARDQMTASRRGISAQPKQRKDPELHHEKFNAPFGP
jgi:hypothetical protein